MKIKVICQQCFHKGYLSESNLFEKIILQESTLYHFRCKHQHDNLVLLQAFKFEILFESGLCAINDKYYLEAVLSAIKGANQAFARFTPFFTPRN